MRSTLRALRLAAAGLAVAASGCHTVTPFGSINTIASGGQNYAVGRGSQVFPASDDFPEKARKALDDLNVTGIAQHREEDTIVLAGSDTRGHRAVVRIRPVTEGTKMHVHARFGLLGDESQSRAYLDRLAARAGSLDDEAKARVETGEASPALKLNARSADAPPGTVFQRRLEDGVAERPYP